MPNMTTASAVLTAATLLLVAGCAGVRPVQYSGLASASYLRPNSEGDSGRIPFEYSPPIVWGQYSKVMIEPVEIYRGPDNQFGSVDDKDRAVLAQYMGKAFTEKLATRFALASQSGPGSLRIKLTLTGAEKTTAVLGQFTHFDIGGNLYDGISAATGGKSAFGGSVSYAVEIYDGSSGSLLGAYVSKQYPNAMNPVASFGALGAAKTGIDKGANALLARLQ